MNQTIVVSWSRCVNQTIVVSWSRYVNQTIVVSWSRYVNQTIVVSWSLYVSQSLCLGHTVPLSCCVNHLFVLPLGSLVLVLWEHQQVLFTYCTARRERKKTKGEWGGGIRVALLGPGERLTLS